MEKCVKYFCKECGRWLGIQREDAIQEGIYPYCPKCKKNVKTTIKKEDIVTCQSASKR